MLILQIKVHVQFKVSPINGMTDVNEVLSGKVAVETEAMNDNTVGMMKDTNRDEDIGQERENERGNGNGNATETAITVTGEHFILLYFILSSSLLVLMKFFKTIGNLVQDHQETVLTSTAAAVARISKEVDVEVEV